MAKGDDAVRRKKNRESRKRMRAKSTVSARVAAIIASKRRRKAGKRRMCEGLCFSLPTPDDPFNDRNDPKAKAAALLLQRQNKSKRPLPREIGKRPSPAQKAPFPERGTDKGHHPEKSANQKKKKVSSDPVPKSPAKEGPLGGKNGDGNTDDCLSKFLVLCLNAIQAAWAEEGTLAGSMDRPLLASTWGVEFWRSCYSSSNIVDTSGACASREQVAWLVSTASDIITRKEKEGLIVASPFLLFLVPSQEKAIEVRSVCKPLKALGVHTVSLHPGASLDHQVHGLKSCEPEFLVSTPERLFELVSLRAIDISRVSILVLDGLESFIVSGFLERIKYIREYISECPQTVVFGDCYGEVAMDAMQTLLREPVCRLSLNDSETSKSAFNCHSVR